MVLINCYKRFSSGGRAAFGSGLCTGVGSRGAVAQVISHCKIATAYDLMLITQCSHTEESLLHRASLLLVPQPQQRRALSEENITFCCFWSLRHNKYNLIDQFEFEK